MTIKLIAMDVDGTLLNSQKQLSARTKAALEQAAAAGIHPVIATGRMKTELEDLQQQLPMVRYAVCCTGAEVVDLQKGEILFRRAIPAEEMRRLYGKLVDLDAMQQVFSEHDGRIHNRAADLDRLAHFGEAALEYNMRKTHVPERDLDAYVASYTGSVNKIHMYFGRAADREEAFRRLHGIPYVLLSSADNDLEIMAAGVDKGLGLQKLAEHLKLTQAQIMAVGDGDNDIAMLRYAGVGVAMGNASAGARAAADRVADDCDHDGLAQVIEELLWSDGQVGGTDFVP